MDYVSLCGIAVGLAMDAFAVCIMNGSVTKKVTPRFAFKLAIWFGLFQAGMPTIGWLIGKAGESFIQSIDHWIALILLSYLGIQMLVGSMKRKKESVSDFRQDDISNSRLFALAVATSIDALATGIILPTAVGAGTALLMGVSVALIGIITFGISYAGVYIGRKFGTLCAGKAEIVGGLTLIAIGVKIFVSHMIG